MNIKKIISILFATLILTGTCLSAPWNSYPSVSNLTGSETFLVGWNSGNTNELITANNLLNWISVSGTMASTNIATQGQNMFAGSGPIVIGTMFDNTSFGASSLKSATSPMHQNTAVGYFS